MSLRPVQSQRGFSLIELLVSLAIGVILLGAASAIGLNSLASSQNSMQLNHLNQELTGVMSVVSREFRRAGFDADTDSGTDRFRNLWFAAPASGTDYSTCAIIRYDKNVPATLGAAPGTGAGIVAANEVSGFRFANGVLSMLLNPPNNTVKNCSGSGWSALNDPARLVLESVEFRYNAEQAVSSPTKLVTSVTITIKGKSPKDDYIRTLSETIQLRNLPALCSTSATYSTGHLCNPS